MKGEVSAPITHVEAAADMAGVVEWLPDAVVVVDTDGTVLAANPAAERLVGRPRGELVGTNGVDLVHPDDLAQAMLGLESVQATRIGTPVELRLATSQGWRLVEVIGAAMPAGRIAVSLRDLTVRRRWEVARDEVARFRSLVHNAAMVTMLVRPDGTVASVSAAVSRQLGIGQGDVCDRPLVEIVDPADRTLVGATIAALARARAGTAPATIEATLVGADGSKTPFELTIVSLVDDPTVEGLVVTAHDISRLRAAQDSLAELAHFDSLTGLANRRAFETALHQQWTLTSRDGIDSVVAIADLDRFKKLNDTFGHAAGDEALRQFSHALRLSVRETDVVARVGGDEFAVILVRCGGELAARGFETVLHERFTECMASLPMPLDFSLGHASLRVSTSAADALHRADLAMLAAKRARR